MLRGCVDRVGGSIELIGCENERVREFLHLRGRSLGPWRGHSTLRICATRWEPSCDRGEPLERRVEKVD